MTRSMPMMLGLIALAVVFVVLGILYGMGVIHFLTRTGQGYHTTHAIVMAVLAIACLVAANFARPRTT